ncbi:maleylacetate [Phlyctema vagabunda]|uniref:Maleylacetate n=1 Tax=Phlyctema vagabunda TaxID=108571 RepID=A0ABR4PTN2_9HELO
MALPVFLEYRNANSSLNGIYPASPVRFMIYGRGTANNLKETIKKIGASKAFIITGNSLATKTPVIADIERTLGDAHAGTFSGIGQHTPIADIRQASKLVQESRADVLISVGGGSPIDAAKTIAYQIHETTSRWIPSIAVPTTLSVAETTMNAGYTNDEGHKVAVSHAEVVPKVVVYDGDVALHTPIKLWTSTGLRAVDHAVELMYHPLASEVPTKRMALIALNDLFRFLPLSKDKPDDPDIRQALLLAAYSSLFPFLYTGGVGLSHSIGHSIGSTYGIPHGITSCMSLAPVVHHKADTDPEAASQVARILPYIGRTSSGNVQKDAHAVASAIFDLVKSLGLQSTLTEYNVPPGDEPAIAARALGNKKDHPDWDTVEKIAHDLY